MDGGGGARGERSRRWRSGTRAAGWCSSSWSGTRASRRSSVSTRRCSSTAARAPQDGARRRRRGAPRRGAVRARRRPHPRGAREAQARADRAHRAHRQDRAEPVPRHPDLPRRDVDRVQAHLRPVDAVRRLDRRDGERPVQAVGGGAPRRDLGAGLDGLARERRRHLGRRVRPRVRAGHLRDDVLHHVPRGRAATWRAPPS